MKSEWFGILEKRRAYVADLVGVWEAQWMKIDKMRMQRDTMRVFNHADFRIVRVEEAQLEVWI